MIAVYGPPLSQSNYEKASPYQLLYPGISNDYADYLLLLNLETIKTIEYSKNKSIMQSGLFENEIDLECSSPAFIKHECWKNTKGKIQEQLIICRFCPCCVNFLQIVNLLNTGLEHSRSNLIFEMRKNLFSECFILYNESLSKLIVGIEMSLIFCLSRGGQNSINLKVCTAYRILFQTQIAAPFYLSKFTILSRLYWPPVVKNLVVWYRII